MLPRRLRLTREAQTHTGKEMRAVSPHFSVSVRPGGAGAGVVVSKKTEKTSVGRHRLKRRVLSLLRPWCSQTYSLVVYARAGSPTLPFSVIEEELTPILIKLLGRPPVR
ncbi:MAG: ribonuclease P protein component [Candidatus Pacebacteria bacterium]|nr:ribonuclease P protein component [Candidatus Paceibacterota bacterium]